jgi:dipeptidyl aminopeptidase/acylaminoacyl peptidase
MKVSPNGKFIAFSIRQADPDQNAYVIRWFVMRTDSPGRPIAMEIDGGQPIPAMHLGVPQAAIPDALPAWSPDSNHFAVRRMAGDRIGLWIVDIRDHKAKEVADGESQVTSFAWISNNRIVYQTGLNVARYKDAVSSEAKHGWVWDGRIAHSTTRLFPMVPDCSSSPADSACENSVWLIDLATSERATAGRIPVSAASAEPSTYSARRADGSTVSLVSEDARYQDAGTPMQRVSTDAPNAIPCRVSACSGARIKAMGWSVNGASIWFVKGDSDQNRIDGAPGDQAALFKWTIASGKVRQVYRVEGTLEGCQSTGNSVVCIEEQARMPNEIVALSLDTGQRTTLVDPNPIFAKKRYPRLDRLIIQDATGPYFAQLIYPEDFKEGMQYPLVITQYSERGFLRGQVGDEYPILPMSQEGFFVLSINWSRPPHDLTTKNITELNTEYTRGGREIVWRVIQTALGEVLAEGHVDEKRMAITGLSAGAEMVNYILQRTDRFRAAIASSGVQDATFFALAPEGPLRDRLMGEFEAKSTFEPGNSSLAELSWSNRPQNLRTPLLINVGEYEALLGFEGTQAVIHAGGPLEMRIFPDEEHIKYHPATYRGIYENNLQWLRYWLKGQIDPSAGLARQYERWKKFAIDAPVNQ